MKTINLTPLVLLAVTFQVESAQAQPQRPKVLVVLSDDHSAAHVGAYGNPDIKTPNLDKFATQGMRFERAYVAAPQCVPSRAALMTGRSPVAVQMTRFSAPLAEEYKTWLELLRAGGYFTGVAGRTFHLDGSGNQPPETREVFDKYNLRTFQRRLDYAGQGNALAQYPNFTIKREANLSRCNSASVTRTARWTLTPSRSHTTRTRSNCPRTTPTRPACARTSRAITTRSRASTAPSPRFWKS